MESVELVISIRGQNQSRDCFDASGDQSQNVESSLVCPVEVFKGEDGRPPRSERAHQRRGNLVWPAATLCEFLELAADDLRNVDDGTEGTRGEQRVARARKGVDRPGVHATEEPNERGFPDTRPASDEHQPTAGVPGDDGEVFVEHSELTRTFEQSGR
jgi:hypothetical protein